jgi:hypothetical protein
MTFYPKFPELGLPWLWGCITFYVDLQLRWGLKQSCSPRWELSNNMSHATWMQGYRGDSRLLVVKSHIANLTPGPSFSHNLCFRCPNGSCEPISDIYGPRAFQWYKELVNPMGFDLCNCSLKIQGSIGTPTPKVWSSFGNVEVQFSHSPRSMKCDSRASLLARNFASPYFGHKPKAMVATK